MNKRIIFALTGASGSIYGMNFLRHLAAAGAEIHAVATETGLDVFRHETSMDFKFFIESLNGGILFHDNSDLFSQIASGSFGSDGMVVLPCSMKTLSGIANGYSSSLLERAADVMLKERRPLILGVRETPYSLVHLKNMTAAAEAGALVLPASPGFYNIPQSIDDLADFISARILNFLKIRHSIDNEWKGRGDRDEEQF